MKSCRQILNLNSSTVHNVLRGWVAAGDIAAVWMTLPLTSSTAACLLKACHQANVVGFYAELISNTNRQYFEHCVNSNFVFSRCPWIYVLLAYLSGIVLRCFSANVPVHLNLARRCENFGHDCSFSGKAHRQLGSCFKVVFFTGHTEFDVQYLLLVHLLLSFHAKDS